jgi:hypothetical protein
MADITRFDSGANPGVDLIFDDVALTFSFVTRNDVPAEVEDYTLTNLQAQIAVDYARNSGSRSSGAIELDPDNGLIWAIAPDNSSIVTVQKDNDTPQQVPLTAAQTETIIGWLLTLAGVN